MNQTLLARLRRFVCIALCLCTSGASAISVVFLNPGKADEKFWVSVTRFMQAAASDLDIQLEVIYAERDLARMVANARAVTERLHKPDYLIAVNEKLAADDILQLTAGTGIKVFLLLNTLSERQTAQLGRPRQKLSHWIGSLVPNNHDAGYLMARELIAAARQKRREGGDGGLRFLAIAGDKTTPASIERQAGLRRAVAETPGAVIDQLVYGDWTRERAREQAAILYTRYPQSRLVWCANDLMAFGAIDAAERIGIRPGKDVLFSGLNNSREAMQARVSGRLSSLASGHFTAGGWALVMLYDYHAGKDFAGFGGSERQASLFATLDARQATRFLSVFDENGVARIDFRRFSRVHSPELKSYRFSLLDLLAPAPPL